MCREKYIEEKLHKKASAGDGEQAQQPPPVSEEDALFAVPDHLNPSVAKPQTADETGSGGVLIWNTGIAEVELPDTFAEKTVRATEQALAREVAARAAKGKQRVESSALPANFSTDFNKHRSDYVAELKGLRKGVCAVAEAFGGLLSVTNSCGCWLADEQRERGFRTSECFGCRNLMS